MTEEQFQEIFDLKQKADYRKSEERKAEETCGYIECGILQNDRCTIDMRYVPRHLAEEFVARYREYMAAKTQEAMDAFADALARFKLDGEDTE